MMENFDFDLERVTAKGENRFILHKLPGVNSDHNLFLRLITYAIARCIVEVPEVGKLLPVHSVNMRDMEIHAHDGYSPTAVINEMMHYIYASHLLGRSRQDALTFLHQSDLACLKISSSREGTERWLFKNASWE